MRGAELIAVNRRLRRSVAVTFPFAYALHDLEEIVFAERWSERASARMRARSLSLPRAVANALPTTRAEMAVAVGVVAASVGVITVTSLKNLDGELKPLQAMLAAFSAHSLSHLGASIVFRGYTPGVATVPLVIIPCSA